MHGSRKAINYSCTLIAESSVHRAYLSRPTHMTTSLIETRLFGSQSRVFRFEGRPAYNVPEERELLTHFASHGSVSWPAEFSEFADAVAADTKRGVTHIRVRLMPAKPTQYIRFELEFYKLLSAAGMQVLAISPREVERITKRAAIDDFYVFDNDACARLVFAEDDTFVREEEITGAEKAQLIALANALTGAAAPLQVPSSD